jgi:hypothetical protein
LLSSFSHFDVARVSQNQCEADSRMLFTLAFASVRSDASTKAPSAAGPDAPVRFQRSGGNQCCKNKAGLPEGTPDWDNTFIFIVAHSDREEAKKNWDAMIADPEFQGMIKSEQTTKLVDRIDRTYMRPTDFSPMK